MKILEQEIQLREETRNAEQLRLAAEEAAQDEEAKQLAKDKHLQRALGLADTQEELQIRMETVIEKIYALPNPEANFGKELDLLSKASILMEEATAQLASPDTGKKAIAIEQQIIELLLQTRRIQPKQGGGGGGSSPGGGGGGTTDQSALAMVGPGVDENAYIEVREVGTSVGLSGRQLPSEFQAGLDNYFNAIEGGE